MVNIVVEDGSVVANANSYVTTAELEAFALARQYTLPVDSSDKNALIIKAADYTEAFRKRFQGVKTTSAQPLQWPRVGVYVDGFAIVSTTIPNDLKFAQMQAAIEYNTTDMLPATGANIKREKVDVIEIEYQDGDGSLTAPSFPKVDQYLDALLKAGGIGTMLVTPIR